MSDGIEVRIKLPLELHQKWSHAATLRGLSLTAFVTSTVSGVLIHTGELVVTPVTTTKPPAAPTPARKSPPAESPWVDDEEDEKPKPVAKPAYDPKAVALDWADDEEE